MVCFIKKSGFQDLAFLVPRYNSISKIPKTMVFVAKIEDTIKLEEYLSLQLPDCVCNENKASIVIRSFTFRCKYKNISRKSPA